MAARSCVVATTLSSARAGRAIARSSVRAKMETRMRLDMMDGLENMRAVRADGKEELEQQLVALYAFRVRGAAVLRADLAELAGPEGEQQRAALVPQRRVDGAIGEVVA